MSDSPAPLLELAARMASLRTLSPGAIHDMRRPLNSLALRLELIRYEAAELDGGQSIANDAADLQRELRTFTNEFDRLANVLAPDEAHSADLRHITSDAMSLTEAMARRGKVRVQAEVAPDVVVPHASRVRHAVLALVVDAIACSPESGIVSITAERDGDGVGIRIVYDDPRGNEEPPLGVRAALEAAVALGGSGRAPKPEAARRAVELVLPTERPA